MFISDKFLEILKTRPKELVREVREHRDFYNYKDFQYNLLIFTWVSGSTTITIHMRDNTVYADGYKSLVFERLNLAKKKYYGFYTSKSEIPRSDIVEEDRKRLVEAVEKHYYETTDDQWVEEPIGPTVDDFL